MRFPGLPILWVVAGDFLKDGERHVVDVVTREVEVGPGGLTGVVSGQLYSGGSGRGLDHLVLFDIGAGPARSPTFLHTTEHSQDCPLWSGRGLRGQLGSY